MPVLTIDNREVEVPVGTSVLEAAKRLGIVIPHFCYHPALGSVGACRLCAMKFIEGPVKGVQMSCMVPAQDGMVVATGDSEAVRLRQLVIEWLMINHPHDCPVCDEGGECLLQDFTIAGGHGIRRYQGKKRTFHNQDLGPHIEHEMNRCIECYRCVRFYQDFAGGTDLGVMGNASRVYFGRFSDGPLESLFSGNLVDICPTGVYTDKTARFRARYWDYEMAPSVCPHCSLGCNITPAARYRQLLKVISRRNDAVNGWFVCDRGRFGSAPVNDAARPRVPLIDGREATWDEALDALILRLAEVAEVYGEGSIAVVGSSRLSLEGAHLVTRLARTLSAGTLCFFTDGVEEGRVLTAVSLLREETAASLDDVSRAGCIAILNSDLREEGPMMLLAVRQAWVKGAPVFLVGDHSPLEQAQAVGIEAIQLTILEEAPLGIFDNPVIIAGVRHNPAAELDKLARAEAKLALLFPGPNSCGVALLAQEHGATSLTEALATGVVRGIIAFEADLPPIPDGSITVVGLADWLPESAGRETGIFLPTTSWVEMAGTYINNEGRAQKFMQVMNPGLPVAGLDPACHPPRSHQTVAPGGGLRPAWHIIADLLARLGEPPVTEPLTGRWLPLRHLDPEGGGQRIW
jgi:NADH-quinone oxidoreductase subunit G